MLLLLLQHETEERRRLASFLQERGVLVETAVTGSQAVNKAILIAPDAIVIDMDAPEALEAATRLRRTLVTRRLPIVAIVSAAPPADSPSVACDIVLPRAYDPDTLLAKVRGLRASRR